MAENNKNEISNNNENNLPLKPNKEFKISKEAEVIIAEWKNNSKCIEILNHLFVELTKDFTQNSIIQINTIIKKMIKETKIANKEKEQSPSKGVITIPEDLLKNYDQYLLKKTILAKVKLNKEERVNLGLIQKNILMIEKKKKDLTILLSGIEKKLISYFDKSNKNNAWTTVINKLTTEAKKLHIDGSPDQTLDTINKNWNNHVEKQIKQIQKKLKHLTKDFLNSKITEDIILKKMNTKDGWKDQISLNKDNKDKLQKNFESEIKSYINNLTSKFDAPFIEELSKKLQNRCIKQLIQKKDQKEKPSQTFSYLISEEIKESIIAKPNSLPEDIQNKIDNEYIVLLEKICNEEIKTDSLFKKVCKTLNHTDKMSVLSLKQKQYLNNKYKRFYISVREYENIINHCFKKMKTIKNANNPKFLFNYLYALEQNLHYFRPFLMLYIDLLIGKIQKQSKKPSNKFQTLHINYQLIDKIIVISRKLSNHLLSQPTTSISNENINKLLNNNWEIIINSLMPSNKTTIKEKTITMLTELANELNIEIKELKITRLISKKTNNTQSISKVLNAPPRKK